MARPEGPKLRSIELDVADCITKRLGQRVQELFALINK